MLFRNEEISDEDRATIDWQPFQLRPRHRFVPLLWTIDRERQFFLVRLLPRGQASINGLIHPGSGPDALAFYWKKIVFPFFAWITRGARNTEQRYDLTWDIVGRPFTRLSITERAEMITALKAAIAEHGDNFDGPADILKIVININL